ncbi:MAG: ribosome small subunit-dependent GTPase A [Clostridia bacterium]
MIDLKDYGYTMEFEKAFEEMRSPGLEPARVVALHRSGYRILWAQGESDAQVLGKFRFQASGPGDFPAVGDFVACEIGDRGSTGMIHGLLPRKSRFSRKMAGNTSGEQVLACNFDYVYIMASMNHDLNMNRLERYLTAAWESNGTPVVVLTKSDLCEEPEEIMAMVEARTFGVPVHAVSGVTGAGLEALDAYEKKGKTIVFLGSSGVGKSTLLNHRYGKEVMETNAIREDDSRGRHTTTRRELFLLPSGAMVIDTPGMRELSLWDGQEGLQETFRDILELACRCRFQDCTHSREPGCAVLEAVRLGTIQENHLESHRKLQKEIAYNLGRKQTQEKLAQKEKGKQLSKLIRHHKKGR